MKISPDAPRILILEENSSEANSLQIDLEDNGCSIVQTLSPKSNFLHSIHLHKPDLVIASLPNEPQESEHLNALTTMKPLERPPIILLSKGVYGEVVETAKKVHACMVFTKPHTICELVANIKLLLSYKSLKHRAFADIFNEIENTDPDGFQKRVGSIIKLIRKKSQLTQATAAEKVDVNYRHYQDIEAGKINLKIDTLFKIFKGFL